MRERLNQYLRPPIFLADEDKTFTASLLHVILWSLLLGICLYTFIASIFAFIQSHLLVVAWLYVLAFAGLTLTLMVIMRRGCVRAAAISVNTGLWIILTVAAYFNGGVAAPAYSGYLIVIICASLLVSWRWGLASATASSLAGAVFLLMADNLPKWQATYNPAAIWSANVAYFFVATMLLALALRAIKRAWGKTRYEMIERLKIEQALSQSEQRFRAIFDCVNDAIFVQDLDDGRILDVNQTMCEMYGYPVEEARHLLIEDLSAGDAPYTQQAALAWMQKAAAGEPQIFEWLARDRAGRRFWVEVNMRRAMIDGKDRLLVVVRDIDDRKRTEATLHREQAYYQAIVNATPVMLWLKDTENRTLHVNPAAAILEGLEASQVEGKSAYELYPRAQAEAYYRDDLEVIRSGHAKLGIVEQHMAAGTGKVMWVETGKVPVRDDQGNIVGVLACAVDITERKEAEQIQAASRQVAEAALMTQNLEEFYQSVHAIISPLIPANNFYIALYDAAHDLFSVPCLFDEFDQVWPPYHPGNGLSAYVMRTGEPLLATSAIFDELQQQGEAEIIHRPMVEWLGVPLKTTQGRLGVMAVQNYSGPLRLNEKHKDLLMFVSVQVAMAIERKRAEQRLQLKEESLRLALDAARMGTWDWHAETDQWTWSDNVEDIFRLKANESAGTSAAYLSQVVLEDRQRAADALANALAGREDRFMVEHRVRWPDDSIHWLEGRGQVFRDAHGQPVRMAGIIADITNRKRMEAELAYERDLLQSLMDNFPDTIYFKDTASRFIRVNRAQVKMLGLAAPEDAIGKTDADFFQRDGLSQLFLAEEQRLMTSGEPIVDRVEYNPTADGTPRWLSASKVPLRDGTGQIVGMVGISRDVTDRMLAQRRDQIISEGLRAVIEAADELIGCADLDTLYRRAVELAREKLKVERCGLFVLDEQGWLRGTYGTDMHRRTSDEQSAHFQPINLEGLAATSGQRWTVTEAEQAYWEGSQHRIVGAGWVGTTFIRTRDRVMGVLYNDTAMTHAPADDAQQEVLAVYCSLLGSLIELRRAEEALRESEALYRRAIEAAGAVPYFLDYPTEAYRFVGDGIQQLTGLTPAEMRPSSWDMLVQQVYPLGESAELTFREAVRDARAGRINVWRADYDVLTQDGRRCWVNDASVQVLDERGRPRGAIGILQDITDRKRVELALRESESTMRALLDAIPDAIFRFDAQGVFKDFIPAKNFVALLPPESFIGRPYAQVLPPEMAQQLGENFQSVLEKGEPRLYEYALPEDGEAHYYESRLVKMAQGDVLGIVRDVTDRKQAELALQQREAYLRAILDNFPYWFWLKDTQGHYLAANRTLAEALGLSQVEELIGKTDWDVTPTVAAKFRADDQEVVDHRSQKFVEEIVIDRGEEKWFETFKSPIFDAQGNVIGTAGFAHDVTARRQAEAAMRESEALFRNLADNAPAFIALSDETGLATYLNRAWQEFRGTVPALPIDEWAGFIHPDDRRRYVHEFRSALQGQRKFTTEYRLRRADGQYRWLLDTVVPRYTVDERFAGFIGISIDMTDRKNAEEALRRSEGRLRLLTDNMVDSISQIDAQHRLVYASPSIERVFGHALRDLLGRPLYELVHSEDASRLYHQVVMATELQAPSLRLEYRYRHAAGHYLWVESEMRLLYDERGDFTGAVFGSRDISTRKQVEAEREELIKELEDKNAELERFTYTVSHDLKSPLITIRGFLGFLEKDARTGNLDRLHADIARITEATTRMQRLLDELLELSRIGRMSNPPEEVSFGKIAREALELVQGRVMARGVQVEIADDLPSVYGDHVRLVEVVQNLIDNAVKFMGDQPEPRISLGALDSERAGMPIFFVKDNGTGIKPEYHERIFGLFNKLDAKSEGTGVGLALVKRIVDLHGGHIWVESDGAGHGSTFFFTLPRPAPVPGKS